MNQAVSRDEASRGGRLARLWPLLGVIFLPNVGAPLIALLRAHDTPLRLGIVLAGAALFVALYLWGTWGNDLSRTVYPAATPRQSEQWRWVPVAALGVLSVALILSDGPRWLVLLIFTSAVAGGRFALSQAIRAVATLVLLATLLGWVAHDSASDLASTAFWTGMAGLLTIIINHFRRTNRALHDAREEIARLAVEAERLRFARDLHDLLGHDLARIALQSELAEALAPTALDQAIAAMREVGQTARTALHEVRAAVAGYRQPALAGELRGAGEILTAAGIAYQCEGERIALPPAVEAVLAWAVREGVTNVVKHSRARHCTVRLTHDEGQVALAVSDDGSSGVEVGADGPSAADNAATTAPGHGGSGLPGLAERAAALGGYCAAGPRPDGGFVLTVTLPLSKEGASNRAGARPVIAGDRAGRA